MSNASSVMDNIKAEADLVNHFTQALQVSHDPPWHEHAQALVSILAEQNNIYSELADLYQEEAFICQDKIRDVKLPKLPPRSSVKKSQTWDHVSR